MFQQVFSTDSNWPGLILRLTLGLVIFPTLRKNYSDGLTVPDYPVKCITSRKPPVYQPLQR